MAGRLAAGVPRRSWRQGREHVAFIELASERQLFDRGDRQVTASLLRNNIVKRHAARNCCADSSGQR